MCCGVGIDSISVRARFGCSNVKIGESYIVAVMYTNMASWTINMS